MTGKFKIPFSSETHEEVLDKLLHMFSSSRNRMSSRHEKWKIAENLFRAYLPETEASSKKQRAREQGSASQFSEVILPYSYALALTSHTYATSVFLGRDPVWQFRGRHGETEQSTQCLEALIAYNQDIGDMATNEFIWLLDAIKYGCGVVGSDYAKEYQIFSEYVPMAPMLGGIDLGADPKWELVEERVEGYCGNRLTNVRPYDWYPDPGVPLVNFQDGEFCGHTMMMGLERLRSMKNEWDLFNLDQLEGGMGVGGNNMAPSTAGSRDNMLAAEKVWDPKDLKGGKVGIFRVVVNVVPEAWKLPGKYYQKWEFLVANNSVIIKASPLGLRHCKFPYDAIAWETDGYDSSTRGMMEVTKPLNDVINWLYNTHMFSVRRSLNGNLIIDPDRINVKDLIDGGPGRIVRMRPGTGYGTDVRSAVAELMNVDPTRGHLSDTQFTEGLMQQITGSNDSLMGSLGRGRKTATEVRTAAAQGANRMKTFCDFASALGWSRLSRKMVANLQQFYDQEKMFRIAGDLMQGTKFVNVDKTMITGEFDYVPVDGTLPVDRFAQATLWKEIFSVIGKNPQIAQQYDISRIFGHMASLAGLKNITQFRITPDEAAMQQAQAGNLVPAGQAMGGGEGGGGYPGTSPTAAIASMVNGAGGAPQ